MERNEKFLKLKRALFDKCYAHLNDMQKEAVYTVNGPLLILAGAGSGKTTVLVNRVVFLIKYGNAYYDNRIPEFVDDEYILEMERALASPDKRDAEQMLPDFAASPCPPYRVLAITFTNKAANEIKTRLSSALDDPDMANDVWAGTFHSVCMRILRVNCEKIGYKKEFTIYDADDTKKAISNAMKRCYLDEKQFPIKTVIAEISRAKERLISPSLYSDEYASDYRKSKIARVYEEYQRTLRESNAMDFDDIIVNTVELFKRNPDILDYYQRKFKYICVDEYQDTNSAQFVLTSMLAEGFRNIMVVGDDDQSIYKFRGATIENILGFDKEFDDSKVIKLEQNYRSTSTILDAANAVIANNKGRHKKQLWTDGDVGEKIIVRCLSDQNIEAKDIVDTIYREVANGKRKYKDFAILYRVNSQSNSIERAFAKSAIPYRMLGGTRFSDRKEIRDVVAYLQLVANHNDRERLLRIINEPRRKIGEKTLDAVSQIAAEQNCSMFEIIENASQYTALSRSAGTLEDFARLIKRLTAVAQSQTLPDLFDAVLNLSGYRAMLEAAGEEEKDRLDNLDEFKSSIIEYVSKTDEPTLIGFLEENALVADVDRYDESADAVVMMTIHSAKGLEFPIVVIPGFEDGIFPGIQNIVGNPDDMEEERRLAYVALTRAKEKIYILHTKSRLLYGQTQFNPVSRFVTEIPEKYIEKEEPFAPWEADLNGGSRPKVYIQNGMSVSASKSRGYSSPKSPWDSPVSQPKITPAQPIFNKKEGAGAKFAPGDRVLHMTFGEGEVLSVRPMGADTLYEVMFDKVGIKKLMATYAKLKKI